MSSKVKILPEKLINQIAAGEVIERPSSVVKELVENAIDAASTDILIELKEAGISMIRVRDNGVGMNGEEARLSLKRHATSKIESLKDLFQVKTLGFRGEALPSIASVSRFKLTTCDETSGEAVVLEVEGGKLKKESIIGAPRGTEIEVSDLFFNTPARLKFLKSRGTELLRCSEVVSEISLSTPKISFKLIHDGRKVFYTPASSSLKERLLSVLGGEDKDFISVEESLAGWHLVGFVSRPHLTFSTSKHCYTFVDGRPVRDRTLLHAITFAYETTLPKGFYPRVVLFLTSATGEVDVNVHPTKREIRFKDGRFIHQFISKAVEKALRRSPQTLVPPEESIKFQSSLEDRVIPRGEEGAHFSFYPPDFRHHKHREMIQEKVSFFSRIHYLGQIKNSYLVCEDGENIIFIDQHAAHERVIFEKLEKEIRQSQLKRQYLLVPISLEVCQVSWIEDHRESLEKLGFEIEPFGGKTILVKSVPELLHQKVTPSFMESMLAELETLPTSLTSERLFDKTISTLACHLARTANEKLSPQEVQSLLTSIDKMESVHSCPHGRPFSTTLPIDEIEKKFRR